MEDITIQGGVGTGAEDAAFHGHNTKRFLLENVRINDNAGNGVRLIADNPDDTTNCDFRNVDLHANAGYDMSFGTNVSDININPDCDLSGDGLGRIQNQGATGIRDRDASKSLMDLKRYNGIGVKKTISGNTMTITEEDKVTTAQTYSLDSGTSPTIQEDTT